MASCFVLVGLVLLALTFISCAISFVAPFWTEVGGGGITTQTRGLWAVCTGTGGRDSDCDWFFEDNWQLEKTGTDGKFNIAKI